MKAILIAEHKVNDVGSIVLRRLPKGGGSFEYVTHVRNDEVGGFSSGHYFTHWQEDSPEHAIQMLTDAVADYAIRVKRGY
jgi:hypothetical protein